MADLVKAPAAGANEPKRREPTNLVYQGTWEMPCDLKREPWCEVAVRVMERHAPYRLRFDGKPKLMWSDPEQDLLDLSRRCKYTVTAQQLSDVLLPAFNMKEMANKAGRTQKTSSLTSTQGGKRSDEAAIFQWAQTGNAPLRNRVIQWILKRMRVGVAELKQTHERAEAGADSIRRLTFRVTQEVSQSYEIPNQ